MAYALLDLDLNQASPTIQLSETQTGVGVVVRRGDRPIGFVLHSMQSGQMLTSTDLDQLIAQELGVSILSHAIATELDGAPTEDPLPSLTVAICTKDHPHILQRCLNSLQIFQDRYLGSLEILVIDNASEGDETRTVVETFPTVIYAYEPKIGLDFARNRALEMATGDFIAYLDDDVVIDRFWFEAFSLAWRHHPDAAAFTGLVLPYELETEAQILFEQAGGFRRGYSPIRYGQSLPGNPLYPCGAGIFGTGANMTFRRSVLIELGGFDLALDTGRSLPGGGDLDIFYRVIRAGHCLVYEPSLMVFHQHRCHIDQLYRQYWSWGLGLMAFIVKSIQCDPSQRLQLIQLVGWWFKSQFRRTKAWVRGRSPLPLGMILIEWFGGIQGLLGAYGRSQRRIQKILHSQSVQRSRPKRSVSDLRPCSTRSES